MLSSDGITCKADAKDGSPKLIFSHGKSLRMLDLWTRNLTILVNHAQSIIPVDYNFKEGMVYYGDFQGNEISKVPLNKSHDAMSILSGLNGVYEPDGLAIDWINDWIYWSSPRHKTISMAKLDGSYHLVVVDELHKLDEPRGVAVDPLRGYLFWSDWGVHAHIGRAGMDGSDHERIVAADLAWPNGVAVDTITQSVYWVDGKLGTVSHNLVLVCHLDLTN
jgi:low density lipoprotein receptor-related protein 5/6